MPNRLLLSLGMGILVSIFWNDSFILPVKLLVVYFHELGHGFSAMASGAYLQQINLSNTEWGETLVKELQPGPGFFVTVSSGYLGSILAGTALFNRGLGGSWERTTLGVFIGLLMYSGILFTEAGSVSFFTAIGWSLFLIIPLLFGQEASRYTILFLGVFFIWYCFFDLFDFTDEITQTDAGILARYILLHGYVDEVRFSESFVAHFISIVWMIAMMGIFGIGILPVFKQKLVEPIKEGSDHPSIENDLAISKENEAFCDSMPLAHQIPLDGQSSQFELASKR